MGRTARYVILAEDCAGMRFVEQYLVVPRWEIETWAEHLLRGTAVSEDGKTGWNTAQSERDCHAAGRLLRGHRLPEPPPECCPASLAASDAEFARLE